MAATPLTVRQGSKLRATYWCFSGALQLLTILSPGTAAISVGQILRKAETIRKAFKDGQSLSQNSLLKKVA
jgi:hypothetical protein